MPTEPYVRSLLGSERQPHPDALVAELAARQHGVVARRQLVALELGHRAIDHRLAAGRLHPVHRGVFAVGHRRLTQHGLWMAAVLACGVGAVLSHRAAGALWRVFRWTGCEVTAPTQRRARDGIEVHAAGLRPNEVTVVDGIPVTTIERTLFDLAAVAPFERVERAFAQADVLRLAGNLGVGDLLERHPGQRGAQTLRTILDDRSLGVGVTQSEFEDRFLALLHASALPRPAKNALVLGRRRDFVWRAPRLVVELDSRSAHDTAHGFEEDRARDRELLVAGWRSLRITWRQLHREPDAVMRDLAALLAA